MAYESIEYSLKEDTMRRILLFGENYRFEVMYIARLMKHNVKRYYLKIHDNSLNGMLSNSD